MEVRGRVWRRIFYKPQRASIGSWLDLCRKAIETNGWKCFQFQLFSAFLGEANP